MPNIGNATQKGSTGSTSSERSVFDFDLVATCHELISNVTDVSSLPALDPLQSFLTKLQHQPPPAPAPARARPCQTLLDLVSQLLLVPHLTGPVAIRFRPLLVDLASRLYLESKSLQPASWQDPHIRSVFITLSKLIGPFEEVYDVLRAFLLLPGLEHGPFGSKFESENQVSDILLALYRILSTSPNAISSLPQSWSSEQPHRIFSSTSQDISVGTRLLAIHTFSLQERLGESARLELQHRWVGQPDLNVENRVAESCSTSGVAAEIHSDDETDEAAKLDMWILPQLQHQRLLQFKQNIANTPVFLATPASPDVVDPLAAESLRLTCQDLCSHVVTLANVLFFRSQPVETTSSTCFIETIGILPTLNNLGLCLASHFPILLSGPPSCGKTELLSYLVHRIKSSQSAGDPNLLQNRHTNHILTIQLGDQSGVDAKQLLGSFISSPTRPGSFEWSEGALTRAVRLGMWVVLEDIDKAGSEVLSTITRLVEQLGPTKYPGFKPTLDLGSRGKVIAGDGFALFATRSTPTPTRSSASATNAIPNPTFLGHQHWAKVEMAAPTQSDVQQILSTTFPRLAAAANANFLDRLISTWEKLGAATTGMAKTHPSTTQKSTSPVVSVGSQRSATLRDLIKWCRRIENLLAASWATSSAASDPFANPIQQEEIFIEACDVFLGSSPPFMANMAPGTLAPNSAPSHGKGADRYSALVELLAEQLGLSSERAWWSLRGRTPQLSVKTPDSVDDAVASSRSALSYLQVGRCQLPRIPPTPHSRAAPINRKFAMTKPSVGLLERLAVCTALTEPVLLVGETGTGKTTIVQHLASMLRQPMIALNLSQQTESGDLLGAFKPLDPKLPATELHDEWTRLFTTTFSLRRNTRFVQAERKAFLAAKWSRLATMWRESAKMAFQRKKSSDSAVIAAQESAVVDSDAQSNSNSRKKRRTENGATEGSLSPVDDAKAEQQLDLEWQAFDQRAREFSIQHGSKKRNLVFSFVEGPLVKALRRGDWVLLDEVNLAAPETLDCLSGLLQSATSSVTLTDRGDLEPIPRHPNFRLFACMNPATDVGKKDLPSGLRSRFTEIYVPSPDSDKEALTTIVETYIGEHAVGDRGVVLDVAECYAEIRHLVQRHQLADGANQRPHFSIRTLSRALTFATDITATFGLRRSLWEGFVMAFTLLLDNPSAQTVRQLIESKILARAKNARAISSFVPPAPKGTEEGKFVQVGPFWLETGPLPLDPAQDYILTPSVQAKLIGLCRAAITRRFPVLIQGPTSAGKTSAVEYLTRRTGHRFVRINNHEHTDIQEYLGSYASDPDTARLTFQEGLLVKALRRGDWIVLDELNLAPTDVLEALNRLLDDNRELVIPETGEVVRPHPHFMLFATQNPPGLYAGRKVLSRAFRNRFLELHFDDVPKAELETILCKRCAIAPSYASKVVSVFEELQKQRQAGRVFETKQAFVTLRDLFRWGLREAVGYQQLAENGYMLIAERTRRNDDKAVVKEVIEKIMKVKIDVDAIYDLRGEDAGKEGIAARIGPQVIDSMLQVVDRSNIVWTDAVQRLLCLVATALRYNEPVLLVGETGAGKTSVCEILATTFGRQLHCVNCHQNTETADLLGGQRPLRNRAMVQATAKKEAIDLVSELGVDHQLTAQSSPEDVAATLSLLLSKLPAEAGNSGSSTRDALTRMLHRVNHSTALFEWHDGPLVEAMKEGGHLLLDEISLADDSVLERLNSVLETGRTLVLAEKSISSSSADGSDITSAQIKANDGFQVLATMNPGGDYGKKELSPALRNRFTEIWVPHIDARSDLIRIIDAQWKEASLKPWTEPLLDFADWFIQQVGGRDQSGMGLRDLLSWAAFINQTATGDSCVLSPSQAFAHGASMTIIDGLGALPATAAMSARGLEDLREKCFKKVSSLIAPEAFNPSALALFDVRQSEAQFGLGPFSVVKGSHATRDGSLFSFGAPTSASNAMRVLRALAVPNKSLLLEGSPGAGKTSLITALAKAAGYPLTRINLSDQTELVDLFGADLPVEGGGPGEFAWKDAAFLTAMQKGEWVLLDEMNLASQTVLEGLNSCLDHRGTVFLPELGRSFTKHPTFRLFAAQNPHHQGGGRKGLPKSFLNRFTKVHIEELTAGDILQICQHLYPQLAKDKLQKMIEFNYRLHQETMVRRSVGRVGAPWEFNLRDLLRWLDLLHSNLGLNVQGDPIEHLASLYLLRFRTFSDRQAANKLFSETFGIAPPQHPRPWPNVTPGHVQIGHALLKRGPKRAEVSNNLVLLQEQLPTIEALMDCVQMKWLAILTGPSGSGKTSAVRLLSQLAGTRLEEFSMNSGTDTMDLLGTFEQYDPQSELRTALLHLRQAIEQAFERCGSADSEQFLQLASSDRLLEKELGLLTMHKDHHVDHLALETALQTLSSHALLANDDPTAVRIVEASSALVKHVQQRDDPSQSAGRFEWTDGPLLRALKDGHWLLLDHANLCSASVLDRLNCLFEPDGVLVISERGVVDGEVPVVRPHPNFRVLMALDPRHGELSRAMRNRGIEISMLANLHSESHFDAVRLQTLVRAEDAASVPRSQVMEKKLFDLSISSQTNKRGLCCQQSNVELAQSELIANWALSKLVLNNSSLAACVASVSALSDEGKTVATLSDASVSYAIRNLAWEHLPLLSHVVKQHSQQAEDVLLALQAWLASPQVTQMMQARKQVFSTVNDVPLDYVYRQPIDLRYNPNLISTLKVQGLEALNGPELETLISAFVRQITLRAISIQASVKNKEKQPLTILEQSCLIAASSSDDSADYQEEAEQATVRQVFPLAAALMQSVQKWALSAQPPQTLERVVLLKTLIEAASFLEKLCSVVELDYSSIQVLVQIVSRIIKDLGSFGLEADDRLDKAIVVLGGKVTLTSGFAMPTIWQLCLTNVADQEAAELSKTMIELLHSLPRHSVSPELAANAVGIAATLSLNGQAWTQRLSRDLFELARKVIASLRSIAVSPVNALQESSKSTLDDVMRESQVASVLDLSIQSALNHLSGSRKVDSIEIQKLRSTVDLLQHSKGPCSTMGIAAKAALWTLDAGENRSDKNLLLMPSFDWVRRIWSQLSDSEDGITSFAGPADFFRPILLKTILDSRMARTSLEEKKDHDASVSRLVKSSGLTLPATSSLRMVKLRSLLTGFIGIVSEALRRSFSETEALSKESGLDMRHVQSLADLSERFKMLANSVSSRQSKAVVQEWSDCLEKVSELLDKSTQRNGTNLFRLGQAWVVVSLSVVRLYLPNVAIDPVVSQKTVGDFIKFCSNDLEAQQSQEVAAEMLVTGRRSNLVVEGFASQLQEMISLLRQKDVTEQKSQTLVRRKPDLKLLAQLHREMQSFIQQVLAASKIESLVSSIEHNFDQQVEDRETSLQASILGFAHRLRQSFGTLQDITAPFLLTLDQIQLGLRTMVQAARILNRGGEVAKQTKILESLVVFPTAASTIQYGELELPIKLKTTSRSGVPPAPLLLTSISAVALDAEKLGQASTRETDVLRRISRTYDQLYQLWALDREREKKAEEAANSLYKSKRIDLEMAPDAEAEEREFQQLFPEYSDVLDQEDDSTADNHQKATSNSNHSTLLTPLQFVQVYRIHTSLFGKEKTSSGVEEVFETNRAELVRCILNNNYASLGEQIDRLSAAFQVAAGLSAAGKPVGASLSSLSQKSLGSFNFYLDPRPDKVSKAIPIVDGLRQRLTELIKEWPEQMVLRHIRDRCDAVLRITSDSPVAKVLSALEQLLTHTEDWEGFASSDTSIKLNREQISGQIVEWRRLELSCWAKILETQANVYEEDVAEWWFRLFEILVRGTRSASVEGSESLGQHITKLIDSIDQFVRSSSVGQFEARLRLLDSYAYFMDLLVELAPQQESQGFKEVGIVLKNVTTFFWQFHPKIVTSIKQQRTLLEKDIRDFIQLASWKDINGHALKQSAQKTHRKLHRCIRKGRDILRQPCDPLLAAHLDGLSRKDMPLVIAIQPNLSAAALDDQLWQTVSQLMENNGQVPLHLVNLAHAWKALEKMSKNHLVPGLTCETVSEGVSLFAEAIVDRQQQLAKLTPAFAKKDNEKLVKNLTARKRKAWSDLLKELRRIGLSAFLKSDVAKKNQDSMMVFTQPPFPNSNSTLSFAGELFESLDLFYYRLLASLPKVRASLPSHSPDLATAELQKGVNFIEHCISIVFSERKRIHGLLSHLASVQTLSDRLSVVHEKSQDTIHRPALGRDGFLRLADFARRLQSALNEMVTVAPHHLSVSLFGNMGADLILQELQTMTVTASRLVLQINNIADQVYLKPSIFFLTSEEEQVVLEMEKLCNQVKSICKRGEKSCPGLSALLHPTRIWIESNDSLVQDTVDSLSSQSDQETSSTSTILVDQCNKVISSVLLIAQDLRKQKIDSLSSNALIVVDDDEEEATQELSDKAIIAELDRLKHDQNTLRVDEMMTEIFKVVEIETQLVHTSETDLIVFQQLARMSPFIHEYTNLLRCHIVASGNCTRSLLKLSHVLSNLMTSLATKGFCKPSEEQDPENQAQDDDETGELETGTGLGDGTGAKDITDQMDDDETMEELQKDENKADEEEEDDQPDREKTARENEEDFGGDLEEIDQDQEDEDDEKNPNQEEEEQEQEQPDETVGQVDPLDPNAVDEKMWGEEKEEEEKKPSADKTDKDVGGEENDDQDQQDESMPKDGKDQNQADSNQKKEKAGEKDDNVERKDGGKDEEKEEKEQQAEKGEKEEEEGEEMEQDEDGKENEEGSDGENEEKDVDHQTMGRKLDDHTEEAENLDLDDDLNLDGDEGDDKDDGNEDDDMGLSDIDDPLDDKLDDTKRDDRKEEEEKEDVDFDDALDQEPSKEEVEKAADQEEDADAATDEQVTKDEGEEAMDEDEEEGEAEDEKDPHRPTNDDGETAAQDQPSDMNESAAYDQGAEAGEDDSAQQEQSSRGQRGRRVESQQQQQNSRADEGMMDQQQESEAKAEQDPSSGQEGRSRANQPEPPTDDNERNDGQEPKDEANPIRSLGDALEQFRRRMQEIQDATEPEEEEEEVMGDKADKDGEAMPEAGEVEHVQNQDDAELQTLGAAKSEEEETQNLGDIAMEDDEEQDQQNHKPRIEEEEDVDVSKDPNQRGPQPLPEERQQDPSGQQKAFMPSDLRSKNVQDEAQVAGNGEAHPEAEDQEEEDEEEKLEEEEEDDQEMTPVPEETRKQAEVLVEEKLQEFRSLTEAEDRLTKAGDLWRAYSALTADLAFSLCEQLRLILAPTLATRLNGDFRTGKRLNMRKIIPFIASDFAKDKIWLRRTKPSAREYQVLLAIDDSKSMSESKSANLAYQTVSLVSGALTRLEVGDVSICRFGETVDILHDFGTSNFNDQNGAHLIDQLGFQQTKTNVLRLVEKSLDFLQSCRESRSGSSTTTTTDLWQLEIIISDGICQDHEKLRCLLRKAAEQRVMLVFVIIDSISSTIPPPSSTPSTTTITPSTTTLAKRTSILSMNNVSYTTDSNGKLQLQMERYLDSFPFDYYVVVRDVEALPDVLAATLRQWAEKIKETET